MTTDEMQQQILDAVKEGKINPDKIIMGDCVQNQITIVGKEE